MDEIIVVQPPGAPDYNSLIHFLRRHVQPPSVFYITRDDVIVCSAWAPVVATTVNVSLRFMAPDGQVLPRFETFSAPANGSAPTVKTFQNAEGYLVSASISTPGAPRGQCFVSMQIKRGGGSSDATAGDVFLQGYPGSAGALGYPQSILQSPIDGRGRMRSIVVPDPAAGAEFALVVPAGVQWLLQAVQATFTASVTVATRLAELVLTDGANTQLTSPIAGGISALEVDAFSWFSGAVEFFAAGLGGSAAIPSNWRMLPGWTVGSSTLGIDAADQWSAIVVTVEEFVTG